MSKTISIGRPISTVFAFLADVENDKLWRRNVVEVDGAGSPGVGATYHQTIALLRGRHGDAHVEIIEFAPDTRIAFTMTTGSVRRHSRYELRAIDNGTEVTLRIATELVGLQVLLTPLLALAMESQLDALEDLKRVLESRSNL